MCERVAMPDGSFAIVCGGTRRRFKTRCTYPGCFQTATVECDHTEEAGATKTCDRLTCRAHAKPIAKEIDWCWLCARAEAKRGNSPRLAL
jgi:hypothetical protein